MHLRKSFSSASLLLLVVLGCDTPGGPTVPSASDADSLPPQAKVAQPTTKSGRPMFQVNTPAGGPAPAGSTGTAP
jgi:hypothetical protein